MLDTYKNRFYSKVNLPENENDCMPWLAGKITSGYGTFKVHGKLIFAHRFSYQIHVAPIQEGAIICHTCDNPSCVNPLHLFIGTDTTNMRDCIRKGRFKFVPRMHLKRKLTEAQYHEIKKRLNEGETMRSLAREYKVAKGTIDNIKYRWTRGEVENNISPPLFSFD